MSRNDRLISRNRFLVESCSRAKVVKSRADANCCSVPFDLSSDSIPTPKNNHAKRNRTMLASSKNKTTGEMKRADKRSSITILVLGDGTSFISHRYTIRRAMGRADDRKFRTQCVRFTWVGLACLVCASQRAYVGQQTYRKLRGTKYCPLVPASV